MLNQRLQLVLPKGRQFDSIDRLVTQHLQGPRIVASRQGACSKSNSSHQKTPCFLVRGAKRGFSKKIASRALSKRSLIFLIS
jgi:hypothetical protein